MSPSKSTRQQLVKVPLVPCLYRHSLNCGYYGIKKLSGKRKEHSLRTKDRKLAERRLKEWLADLSKVDAGVERSVLPRNNSTPLRIARVAASPSRASPPNSFCARYIEASFPPRRISWKPVCRRLRKRPGCRNREQHEQDSQSPEWHRRGIGGRRRHIGQR